HVGISISPSRAARGGAVREVAARGEAQPEDRVARLHEGEVDRRVRLRARMGLHVREAALEEGLGAVDRELLGDVDERAAAVVAAPGITLGVLVRELRALRL